MNQPEWWEIVIGVLLILIGFSLFFLFKKAKEDVNHYKIRQLEELNKKDKRKQYRTYEDARLILPWSQRIKLVLWPVVGLALILVGIAIACGITYSFFIR